MRFALVLLAACSQAPTLTIGVATNPLIFAFRPDGGDWQQAAQVSTSEQQAIYEVPDASGTIAIACMQPGGSVQVEELDATEPDLAAELYAPMVPWPQLDCSLPSTAPRVEVDGSMVEPGYIYVGDRMVQGDGEWTFSADVTAGAHDIVAFDTDHFMVFIDHGVTTDAPTIVPTIDVENGIATGTLDLETTIAFSQVETVLTTVHGTTVALASTALYVPSEALATGDSELVHVVAETEANAAAQAYVIPTEQAQGVTLEFADVPNGATFGGDDVSVDFSAVTFSRAPTEARVQYTGSAASLAVTATAAWLADHGATTLSFDDSVPGFDWPLGASVSQRELLIQVRDGAVTLQTALLDPP